MLVKSPSKKTKTKPNRRKPSLKKEKKKAKATGSKQSSTDFGKRHKKKNSRLALPAFKPWKIILGAIVIGILGMVYLNHVFATQKLLTQVQELEQQYQQAKRRHAHYRLTYDRMIGPAAIYDKAKAAGFINGGPAEEIIEVEPNE